MEQHKYFLIDTALFLLFYSVSFFAQDLTLGVDFVNRYIWRGSDLGANAPSIQPNVLLTAGNVNVGFWGAYSTTNEVDTHGSARPLDEIDLYVSYNFVLDNSGSINLGFTDYMNPNSGVSLTNFNNYNAADGPGAHFIEFNAGYSGPTDFPIAFSLNIFIHNVESNPVYFQAGYNTSISNIGFSIFAGGSLGRSTYYGTNSFEFLNVGLTASKSVPLSEKFSLPVFSSILVNPSTNHLYYVIGIKL